MSLSSEIQTMVRRVEERIMTTVKNTVDARLFCHTFNDPYYMLSPEDSYEWACLIHAAKKISPEFSCHLLYIRGCGTRLIPDDRWGYILKPDIQPGGWESLDEWKEQTHLLLDKFQPELVKILTQMAKFNQYFTCG